MSTRRQARGIGWVLAVVAIGGIIIKLWVVFAIIAGLMLIVTFGGRWGKGSRVSKFRREHAEHYAIQRYYAKRYRTRIS